MRRMRLLVPLSLAVAASGTWAKPPDDISWAKPGVSLEAFLQDSADCAETSRQVKAYVRPHTLVALDALSSAQLVGMAEDMGLGGAGALDDPMALASNTGWTKSPADVARRSANFGEHYTEIVSNDVRDELQAALDQCLAGRGYVRIRLTDDQRRTLSRLKRLSPARSAYLHAIDSDAAVIARQRIAAGF